MKFAILTCIAFVYCIQIAAAARRLLVGGWSPVDDVNSPQFKKIVNFATEKAMSRSNTVYLWKPVEVTNASKQVVAGMNYEFTMVIGATECKKNDKLRSDDKNCAFQKCGPQQSCNVTVWDKSWQENGTKVTKLLCDKEIKKCEDN